MSITGIREQLVHYIENADAAKLQALHVLLDLDNPVNKAEGLTGEQWQILSEERVQYLNGQGKSYSAEEALHMISTKYPG